MDKRVRPVQNVETVDIAHRVEKAFQAVVAAGAILNADDILVAGQLARGLRGNSVPRCGRNVVKKERDAQRVGDRRIVVNQLFLLQGHEPRVMADTASTPRRAICWPSRRVSRVETSPILGHHRRATGRLFHAGSGDGDLLFLIEDKLAVGAAAENTVACGELALHLLA